MDIYAVLLKIFAKLGVKKGYYGEFIFKFEDGNIVHFDARKSLKPDILKELINK